jgi:hypothetical protein
MRRRDYVLFSARFNYIGTSPPSAVPFAAENSPLPRGGHGLRCCRSLVARCFVLEGEMAAQLRGGYFYGFIRSRPLFSFALQSLFLAGSFSFSFRLLR